MSFYNEILPNLYLGSIEASQDFNFICSNNISVIINCSKDIDNKFSINLLKPLEDAPEIVQKWLYDNSYYIKYYRIPVDDSGRDEDVEQFYFYVKNIIHIIIDEYRKGKNILVHCLAGNQRSATFITVFIMYYKNLSLQESIKFVLEKKPNVFFFGSRINFMNSLLKFEEDINN
jgi:dual specificity MAP kinase phosphatase